MCYDRNVVPKLIERGVTMPKVRYEEDLKQKALAMMETEGASAAEQAFHVKRGTLYRWRNQSKADGEVKAKPAAKTGRQKKKAAAAGADKAQVALEARDLLSANDQLTSEKLLKLTEEKNQLLQEMAKLEAENQRLKEMLRVLIS